MEILSSVEPIVRNILGSHFPEDTITVNDDFEKILGGADTEIFSFSIKVKNQFKQLQLILRLYRAGADITSSRREYETLNQLHKTGLSVPKPYGYTGSDNELKRPFLIMELIDGEMLSEVFFRNMSDAEEIMRQLQIGSINFEEASALLTGGRARMSTLSQTRSFLELNGLHVEFAGMSGPYYRITAKRE